MVGTRHILGLAIDDSGVVATELCTRAGRTEVHGIGEFSWEQELTADNAKELGLRLRQFLRERGFTAKRAVVGLAAKWVMAKEVEAPPAAPEALAGMLSIQAERLFSMNAGELVFDYCGKTSTSQKSQVLLLAARRRIVEQIKELAEAAGLHLQSMTVSAFACGSAPAQNGSAGNFGLYTRPTYCEFWGHVKGRPRFIKHIPLVMDGDPTAYTHLLTNTIRRQVLLSSQQDQAPPHHVTAYDASGLSEAVFKQLNEQLSPQITVHNGRAGLMAKGLPATGDPQEARTVAAAAVAWTGVGSERPAVDFLNPRLGEKKKASHKRVAVWAGVGVAVCLIAVAVFLADWQADRSAIATYTQQLADMDEQLSAAKDVVARLTYAESWGDTEPRFLKLVRELTLAFPEEGTIWATSLALDQNGSGLIVGKVANEASFYEVFDKIRGNEAFSGSESRPQMVYLRDGGRDSREKDFAIRFTFKGAK